MLQATGAGAAGAAAVPGRYRVRRAVTASFSGAAYEGLDRVTQQEVELHLLLAEVQDAGLEAAGVQAAIAAFARRAEAAAQLAHPAIRPLLRFDRDAGLLILPHADGPSLRALIRAPGMPPARARALVSFLLEHPRGGRGLACRGQFGGDGLVRAAGEALALLGGQQALGAAHGQCCPAASSRARSR